MYQNFNEQFSNASRQLVDTAAQVNRMTLENAEKVFGLQLASFEETMNATFAFLGELSQVRDLDGVKTVMPKGAQVVRENTERAVSTSQEVFGHTLKTGEAIAQLAKAHIESASVNAQAEAEKVVKAATKAARAK